MFKCLSPGFHQVFCRIGSPELIISALLLHSCCMRFAVLQMEAALLQTGYCNCFAVHCNCIAVALHKRCSSFAWVIGIFLPFFLFFAHFRAFCKNFYLLQPNFTKNRYELQFVERKRGIIFGALNEQSIAWKVAEKAKKSATITLSNTRLPSVWAKCPLFRRN